MWRNIKARSQNQYSRGKQYYIIFPCVCVRARPRALGDSHMRARVGVFIGALAGVCLLHVDLFTQYATRRRHIVCILSGSTKFFDIIS